MSPAKLAEALHALASAAESLFRTAGEPEQTSTSLRAVSRALTRLRWMAPRHPEVEQAAVWLIDARACWKLKEPDGVRHAANRIYESALLLLGPHLPPTITVLLAARTTLRDVLGEAQRGDVTDSAVRRLRHVFGPVRRVLDSERHTGDHVLSVAEERLARAQLVLETHREQSLRTNAVSSALVEIDRVIDRMLC